MSRQLFLVPEHEFEPQVGLPEKLPSGEQLMWQGSPDWKTLAVQAFHVRKLVVYFAVMLTLRLLFGWSEGTSVAEMAVSILILASLAALSIGLMTLMAWLTARTTLYTITSERIVMRIGIVLSVTFNLPFKSLDGVGMKQFGNGTGDLPLSIGTNDRIAYFHIWPHARPWKFKKPEPMLRSIADVVVVANILTQAMKASSGGIALPIAAGGIRQATHRNQKADLATAA